MAAYLGDFADAESGILLPSEAELYTESLQCFSLKEVGSPRWQTQHGYMEKLNMQAIMNVLREKEDYIREALISYDKIPILIYDLILTEVWKNRIYPELLKLEVKPSMTLPLYMTIFHEATVLGLIETILFHKEACECAGDKMLDLVDYCYRKLNSLVARSESVPVPHEEKTLQEIPPEEELRQQDRVVSFTVSMKALSVVRYITDHMTSVPLSIMTRLLNTHDIPHLLVQLIELKPWRRQNEQGEAQHFVDGKWKAVPQDERFIICKLEGQVWLALYNTLMNPESQRKYEYTSHRKDHVLKLRKYLNEFLVDQISCLVDMQRFLDHLSVMDPPTSKQELILEQVPEILPAMEREGHGKWAKLAKYQHHEYFSPTEEQLKEQARRLADTYNLDVLEALAEGPPKCANCGQEAAKRCSRCKNEWYCSRPCQVKDWAKHKPICNLTAPANT